MAAPSQIPVKFLDVLKHELVQCHDSPQYFCQFVVVEGSLDAKLLAKTFDAVSDHYGRFAHPLLRAPDEANQHDGTTVTCFVERETNRKVVDEIESLLETCYESVIRDGSQSPFILIAIRAPEARQWGIVLWINHVVHDATSGYAFFSDVIRAYNAECHGESYRFTPLRYVDDLTLINEQKAGFRTKDKLRFAADAVRSLAKNAYYQSSLNRVAKLYDDATDADRKVLFSYDSIKIGTIQRTKDQVSKNSIVCAALAKAFDELRGDELNHVLCLSLPMDMRRGTSECHGNHVINFTVKVQGNRPVGELQQAIQSTVDRAKSSLGCLASYQLYSRLAARGSANLLGQLFRKWSKKHHFYVTNFGRFTPMAEPGAMFHDTQLVESGGFNYPLQASLGMICTLTYSHEKVGIGVAVSPKILSKEESRQLLKRVKSLLADSPPS